MTRQEKLEFESWLAQQEHSINVKRTHLLVDIDSEVLNVAALMLESWHGQHDRKGFILEACEVVVEPTEQAA